MFRFKKNCKFTSNNYKYVNYRELIKMIKIVHRENLQILFIVLVLPASIMFFVENAQIIDYYIWKSGTLVTIALYYFWSIIFTYILVFSIRKIAFGKIFMRTKGKEFSNNKILKNETIKKFLKLELFYLLNNSFLVIIAIVINTICNYNLIEQILPGICLFIIYIIYFLNKPVICKIFIIEYDEEKNKNEQFFLFSQKQMQRAIIEKKKLKWKFPKT